MKKTLIISSFFLVIGIILGTKVYTATTSIENTFSQGEIYYFLQEGVYSSKDIMEENTININTKLVENNDNKYYVYLGITKNTNNAKKIKKIYTDKGYDVYIKEQKLANEEFSSNVTQFDLLIDSTDDNEEILKITEVVFANYEEIVKNQ